MQASTAGRAAVRDGTELTYRIDGQGSHRIALVHSLAADLDFWRPVVERLAGSTTILTYDCRGHGTSGKPKGPDTVEQFADDLADLLDAVQWPAAAVAGASMGGCVALAFAARHPARTLGLGLIDTTAWYGADAPQQWAERAGKAKTEGLGALVGFQKTRWFGDAFREQHPEVVEATVATFLRNDVDAYVETCRMLGAADLRAALPGIRVPTRIVVGEEDYATPPAMAQALHAGIAGSSYTVIDKGRHLTPLDNPDRIVAELRTLLEAAA